MNAPTYGLWLLLGIVLAPLYLMLGGWFLGEPRGGRLPWIGVGLLLGFTVVAWTGLAVLSFVIELAFSS